MEYCILDLASLRYQWNQAHTTLVVLSALGEVLTTLETNPALSDREAAFLGCEDVLERVKLKRTDAAGVQQRCRVALYNPYSGEVSVGSVPSTTAYADGSPLATPPQGLLATLEGEAGEMTLRAGGRTLRPVEQGFTTLTRTYAAHRR